MAVCTNMLHCDNNLLLRVLWKVVIFLLQDAICSTVFGNCLNLVPSVEKSGYGTVPRSVHSVAQSTL